MPSGERRALGLMALPGSSYHYETRRSDDPLRTRPLRLNRKAFYDLLKLWTGMVSPTERLSLAVVDRTR